MPNCDSGVRERLKAMSPDLYPILEKFVQDMAFVGGAEKTLNELENTIEKRTRKILKQNNILWVIVCILLMTVFFFLGIYLT